MAFKYTGDKSLGFNFNPTGSKPLDRRVVVESVNDLTTSEVTEVSYVGMVVYAIDKQQLYMKTGTGKTADAWVTVGKIPTAQEVQIVGTIGTHGSGTSVEDVLKDINERLQSAEAGGVTEIQAGSGITTSTTDGTTKPIVSIKLDETEGNGNLLKFTASGLTACLYYEIEDEGLLPEAEPTEPTE